MAELDDVSIDYSFFFGLLAGLVLSRSGVAGVLVGVVIGILICRTEWLNFQTLYSYING
jgi:hypothetical protein